MEIKFSQKIVQYMLINRKKIANHLFAALNVTPAQEKNIQYEDMEIRRKEWLHIENEDVYIAKIKDIIMTNDTNNEESINLISDLKNAFGNEIIKNKKISTNDSLIDALLKQY